MEKVMSGQVNIRVEAKVNGKWVYVSHYFPGFDPLAKAKYGVSYLRKLALAYVQKWHCLVGATAIRTVLD